MYYAHFGLKQPPFKITPNTEFFFSGGNRGPVLEALLYAINSGEGIIKVVGEVGSGKTMLCRMLQTLLPVKVESIYLANPSVAPEDVLHAIAFELQLKLPKNADRLQVMQALQSYLLNRHAEGKQVVIFVEEAQGMPLATLEEIRLLSNLETKSDKLLQIVLFGQPELDVNLNQPHIRQLRERITHSFNLGPLSEADIGEYLIFRLRAAGYFGPHLFMPSAIRSLSRAAEGLVRRVNILADKALLAAFSENVYQVTPRHVMAAISDSEFGAAHVKGEKQKRWLTSFATIVGGICIAYIAYSFSQPVNKSGSWEAQARVSSALLPATQQESGSDLTRAAASTRNMETTQVVQAALQTKSAVSTSNTPTANETAMPEGAVSDSIVQKSLVQQRLDAGQNWLANSPPSEVTVQLMGGADEGQLEAQLKTLGRSLDLEKLYLFRTKEGGRPFIIATYGSFANWNAGAQARSRLPQVLQANQPKLRSAGGISKETK